MRTHPRARQVAASAILIGGVASGAVTAAPTAGSGATPPDSAAVVGGEAGPDRVAAPDRSGAPDSSAAAAASRQGGGLLGGRHWDRAVDLGISLVRKSDFAPAVRSDAWNLVWGLDDRFGFRIRDWSFRTGYSIHHSRRYTLYDYGRFEVEYHPHPAAAWRYGLRAGGAYTRANGKAHGFDDIHASYGLEVGAWLEGPWERFAYTYDSGAGGYQRFDMMFALLGGPSGPEGGTMYSIYTGPYVQMLRIGMYVQGSPDRPESELTNRRPLPHKALAHGVLVFPLLPLTLLLLLAGRHMD
jgi:hypothetical protein